MMAAALLGAASGPLAADTSEIEAALRDMAQAHAQLQRPAAAGAPAPRITRVEVSVGELDGRIKLAPCTRMEPYLPPGLKPWGRTRLGIRCVEGPTRWNVFLPVTVRVYAQALVAATALPGGSQLSAASLALAEVDLAEDPSPAIAEPALAVGRTTARPLAAGEPLRMSHLRPKQWFAAGDTVKVLAIGRGFAITSEGRALAPGIEGRTVRVRAANGRILTGMARAPHTVEVRL
jgi:flagella basal body P-ring formation protein FlgA